MAHKTAHRQVSGWIPEGEAVALEALAEKDERSFSYTLRQAVRHYLALRNAEVPTLYEPAKERSA